MHPVVFGIFGDICRGCLWPGARVLEIGAMRADDTLVCLPALRSASLRVGVNLSVARPYPNFRFVHVAADGLATFADASFDAILCNSVLEHDAHFWRTLDGALRVAWPGTLIAIGVPGYADLTDPPLLRLARRAARLPFLASLFARVAPGWDAATPTLVMHNYPGDHYRFSEQAMRGCFWWLPRGADSRGDATTSRHRVRPARRQARRRNRACIISLTGRRHPSASAAVRRACTACPHGTARKHHIELASHDVLLADGAPAESYRDDGNRWLFRNINKF
jgi:hypothetical protein